ncbi:MAG TPA: helix-turn-helix domain-containing protein [Anaerolineales bacterium]|nr:helix-turn-helix domain-containing protein [Anaerolineales bacterium]
MPTPTRLRILEQLRTHQAVTVAELSRALGMTGANIRHHLAILESNDVIDLIGQRREPRGRPVNVYGLSRRILGDGLDELAGALLDAWLGGDIQEEVREAALRNVASRLAGQNLPEPGQPLLRRFASLVDRLNELHYQARWEAGAAGPRILFGHCPYAQIIARYPALCRMDAHLLELQLNSAVSQTAKLEPSATGLPQCIFAVG